MKHELDLLDLADSAWIAFTSELAQTMAVGSIKTSLSCLSTILRWFNVELITPPALASYLAGLDKMVPK